MAQEKQQEKQSADVNNAAHWRGYGLYEDPPVEVDPEAKERESEAEEGEEEESGESEGDNAAASQEEDSEALADLKADKGDEGEETPSDEDQEADAKKDKKYATIAAVKRDLEKTQKQLADKEEQIRNLQSRADKAQAQLDIHLPRMWEAIQAAKRGETQSSTEGDLPEIDDEAVVDGKTLKTLIKGSAAKRQAQEEAAATQNQKLAWANSQPDIADVRKLLNEENWKNNPEIVGIPTDSIGIYFKAKTVLLERKLTAMEKAHKQEIEKVKAEERKKFGSRKPIPPTGGSGLAGGAKGQSLEPRNEMEKRFLQFFGKNAVIQKHGR